MVKYFMRLGVCLVVVVGCNAAQEGQLQSGTTEEGGESEQQVPASHVAGLEVYTEKCGLCHDHGEAGSPRLGNPLQWAKRAPQGVDVLTKHAVEGFEGKWGEMPPQGDDLSPEQVRSAVEYMLYRFESAETE